MQEFLLLVAITSYIALVIVTSVRPIRSTLSDFELERRVHQGSASKEDELRETYVADISAWLRIMASLLLVIFVLSLVAALGWLVGVLVAVVGVLQYVAIAHLPWAEAQSQKLYLRVESVLLGAAQRHGHKFRFLRGMASSEPRQKARVDSREELLYVIENCGTVLSVEERKLLKSGLSFGATTVEDIMTPRSVIDSIAHDELLGPLVLDDLHKTGHSRFPVIDQDIDHVVGVLHLRDVVALRDKKSVTATEAMKQPVHYIKNTQTLDHALAAFLKTHHLLFVVVNEYRETVGVISLEDVIEALLGRKIMDEFDSHEDLRKVAERNPRANNLPKQRRDV